MANKKFWSLESLFNRVYNDNDDALKVDTVQKKFKDTFPGIALDASKWNVYQVGNGMSINVSGGALHVNSGTMSDQEIVILSQETYTVPVKVLYGVQLSQIIANQEVYIGLVSVDDNGMPDEQNVAAWKFANDGGDDKHAHYQVNNGGASRLDSGPVAITNSLLSWSLKEIDLLNDSAWFYDKVIDSSAPASNTYVRHQQVPDPNRQYKIRIRVKNLSIAPASNTMVSLNLINIMDFSEVATENINAGSISSTGGGSGASGNVAISSPLPAGGNNIGTVNVAGSLGISGQLPAGTNKIGSVDVATIPEVEVKNDAGNPLNVTFPTIPAGTNTIGNVGINGNVTINTLPAGANNIGKVDINSLPEVEIKNDVGNPIPVSLNGGSLPTGTNNIGKVDINSIPEVEIKNDTGNPLAVTQTGALPAGANNIGSVNLGAAIPAGSNLIGYVKLSNGTYSAGVASDGSQYHINRNSGSVEIFTATTPGVVSVGAALPAGSNLVGKVKLSNGTTDIAINTNGAVSEVNYNSAGTEIFTATAPGNVKVTNGTTALAIDGNGGLRNVNYSSTGNELFTAANPANMGIQSSAIALPMDIQATYKNEAYQNITQASTGAIAASTTYYFPSIDTSNFRIMQAIISLTNGGGTFDCWAQHSWDGTNWLTGAYYSAQNSGGGCRVSESLCARYVRIGIKNNSTTTASTAVTAIANLYPN